MTREELFLVTVYSARGPLYTTLSFADCPCRYAKCYGGGFSRDNGGISGLVRKVSLHAYIYTHTHTHTHT